MQQLSRGSRLPVLLPVQNDGLIGRSAQGRQRGRPYDLDMDDAHALIELHFAGEPAEAAALRRILAAVPACRSAVFQLLADRAGEVSTRRTGRHDNATGATRSGGSVTRRLRTVSPIGTPSPSKG
jgi:hypothetical protein